MIDFSQFRFQPVILLPKEYEVYDFSGGYDPNRRLATPFGVGKYNEKRKAVYTAVLFGGKRDIHMGVDIAAPVGTPVHSFYEGEIFLQGYNGAQGDYGATIVSRHVLNGVELYALHGHLSRKSLEQRKPGTVVKAGEVIAWVGDRQENGGWNPHLHFQLSFERPAVPDMPGAVSDEDLEESLKIYPDPRLVLGPIY